MRNGSGRVGLSKTRNRDRKIFLGLIQAQAQQKAIKQTGLGLIINWAQARQKSPLSKLGWALFKFSPSPVRPVFYIDFWLQRQKMPSEIILKPFLRADSIVLNTDSMDNNIFEMSHSWKFLFNEVQYLWMYFKKQIIQLSAISKLYVKFFFKNSYWIWARIVSRILAQGKFNWTSSN